MNTKTNCAMNASHTPGKPDSRLPWRVVPPFYDSEDPNLWQVWTRFDDTPGSRNNYVVADDIQTEGEAQLIALAPTILAQRDELRAACLAVVTAWESGDLAAAARQCEAALNSKD